MQVKRFYTLDDNLELDWIDLDLFKPVKRGFSGEWVYFPVLNSRDGHIDFKFSKNWIWTPENPSGIWHETPQSLAKQLRGVAKKIQETPKHAF